LIVIAPPVAELNETGTDRGAIFPRQRETLLGVTIGAGGVALTVTDAELVQPEEVNAPVTVYSVFAIGLAITTAPVVVLRPAAGLQE